MSAGSPSPSKKPRSEPQAPSPSAPHAAVGGSGKSDRKLVGFDKFVRHNPRSDRFPILDFDHIEFWCGDATNTARRFATAFGLQMVAGTDIDNGNQRYTSYVLKGEDIRMVFTAPYWTESPTSKVTRVETFPEYSRERALDFVAKHGMAGRAIGLQVADATLAYERAVEHGAKGIQRATKLTDDNGTIVYSEVEFYTDVVLRFVEGRKTYKGNFMPGYKDDNTRPTISYGLHRIDHIVSNTPCLTDITDHLEKILGFHEFGEFTAADVGTVDSGLNSMVMANNDETVLMPINEPTFGTRRKSQIQSFLEHNQGSGIQHIAISTPDILATMEKMSAMSKYGGVEFMPAPGASYYEDHVPKKMGNLVSKELIDKCRAYGILIDRDEEGGLLQIFTKPLLDRPTLFVEIIQRVGCPLPDGRQKPACGGFGKGNFGALFKSIEDFEKMRDGEKVQ
jgi:4-hydroxyphenylpyruvate dioxygenase